MILGPIFSGIVKVSMMLAQQAEIPQIMGGEASDLTQQGNAYLFRTSFGQQVSMPKIANYIRDVVKAKSVAVIWVQQRFRQGRPRQFHQGDEFARHQGRRRPLDRIRPDRFRRRRRQGEGRERRSDLRLHQRGRERALPARGAQAGHQRSADRRNHAARPEGDRPRGRRGERRARPRRPLGRHSGAGRAGVQDQVQRALQVRAGSQRHQGLYRRLCRGLRDEQARQVRLARRWRSRCTA